MSESNAFKFSCPHCGRHLEAESEMIGMTVDCPDCGQLLEVPHNGKAPLKECVSDAKAKSDESSDLRNETVVRPQLPVITVIKGRECIVDRCKNRLKTVGIGIALLCLFVGVGIIAQIANENVNSTEEGGGQEENPVSSKEASRPSASTNKKVLSSVECLLDFLKLRNERRLRVLSDSLQDCPNDFKDAVSEYLISVTKSLDDMISDKEKEEAMKVKALFGLLGAVSTGDSQRGVNAGLELGDMAYAELQDKARRRLRDEIEKKRNRLIEVAQTYGIDSNAFEEALVSRER